MIEGQTIWTATYLHLISIAEHIASVIRGLRDRDGIPYPAFAGIFNSCICITCGVGRVKAELDRHRCGASGDGKRNRKRPVGNRVDVTSLSRPSAVARKNRGTGRRRSGSSSILIDIDGVSTTANLGSVTCTRHGASSWNSCGRCGQNGV